MDGCYFRLDGFHSAESDVVRPAQRISCFILSINPEPLEVLQFHLRQRDSVYPHHLDFFRSFPVCKFLF